MRLTGSMKVAAGIATLAAVAAAVAVASGRQEKNVAVPAVLNEVLTNEMSDTSSLARMDRAVEYYMQEWNIRGASLAIMRNDSLLYAKGYGWADEEKGVKMEPKTLMRLASVSKLITAAGIMKLQEEGRLSLDERVFGDDGILSDSTYTAAITDPGYYKITVEHLLRHQGGFTARYGDPMFSTKTVMQQNNLSAPPDGKTLVRCVIKRKLGFAPGSSQSYSNFGYLLLSQIIEKISGMSYEDYIQENILHPAGCHDFHIAGTYYKDKLPNETRYYVQSNDPPVEEYNGSGRTVTRCYGGNDIKGLSGAGAWMGSVPELTRFVACIDGRGEVPDILSISSIRDMTEWFDQDTFSLGWNDTKPTGEWTRTGTFSGTSALVKYFPDGECWVMVTNTSTWKGPGFTRYTAQLFSELRQKYSPLLPARDFFTVQEGN